MTLAIVAFLVACGPSERVKDPIAGVPMDRQSTISRAQLGFRWPLVPGTGTLACAADGKVILFRAGGVTYVVHGEWPGAADISPLRVPEPSGLPSNPVKRLTQNVRMDAFASLNGCRSVEHQDVCRRNVEERFGVSSEEARLIEAEGQERAWPPLTRGLVRLDPLITAGRSLCAR
jgi:hypothetical protein